MIAIAILNQEFDGGFNAEYRFSEAFLQQDPLIMITLVAPLSLCVLGAKRLARRALEPHVQQGSAIMDARQLVARADRWAVIFGLGGLATVITVFGVYASATESDPLLFLDRHWQIAVFVVFGFALARRRRELDALARFPRLIGAFCIVLDSPGVRR